MSTYDMLTGIHKREFERLAQWAQKWTTETVSFQLAATVHTLWWYDACSGHSTSHGAYARQYELAEPILRRDLERQGRYLPIRCKDDIPLPEIKHRIEASVAYWVIFAAWKLLPYDWTMRSLIADQINACWPGRGRNPRKPFVEELAQQAETALVRLCETFDAEPPGSILELDGVRDLMTTEWHRSQRWYNKQAEILARRDHGQVEQDNHPRHAGSQDGDDLLGGGRHVRVADALSELWSDRQQSPDVSHDQ